MIGSASEAKPKGGATIATVALLAAVAIGVTGGAVWIGSTMSPSAPVAYADAE